jgi:hypothetical protein
VTVSRYVGRRRFELGLLTHEVSIPQTHLAGAEAEVEFGEFYSTIAGVRCVSPTPLARIYVQLAMAFDCSRPQSQTVNTSKLAKDEGELRASTTTNLVLAPCRHRIDRCTVDNQRPRLEGSLVKEMK